MITEEEYSKNTDFAHRKKYAQFFTPEPISEFMAKWVLNNPSAGTSILEPALGLGIFSRSLLKINANINIISYDIDEKILTAAKSNFKSTNLNISIKHEDYITSPFHKKYDGIICNPPYLKFHDYNNAEYISLINNELNLQLTGFTNLYALFLLKSIFQLKDGGRLAYLIPSEFLNSDYGVQVKQSLIDNNCLKHIVIIDFQKCAFDDALTTACILLCEKTSVINSVKFSKIDDINQLDSALTNFKTVNVKCLNPTLKWKQFYSETKSSKYNHLVPFSTFAKVSRGIATGANKYFTFNISKKATYGIPTKCLKPCICHSTDIKKIIFTKNDFAELLQKGKNIYIFDGCADKTNQFTKDYILLGLEMEINKRFLTASRNPWYAIENRVPSPIWVSVFSRNGLKFIRNKANVYNLTTFHCIYNTSDIDTDIIFAYLITDMAKEIFLDNSRQYGNGLTKFEPNDLNKGNIIDFNILSQEELNFIKSIYHQIELNESCTKQYISILDKFFRTKYSLENTNELSAILNISPKGTVSTTNRPQKCTKLWIPVKLV